MSADAFSAFEEVGLNNRTALGKVGRRYVILVLCFDFLLLKRNAMLLISRSLSLFPSVLFVEFPSFWLDFAVLLSKESCFVVPLIPRNINETQCIMKFRKEINKATLLIG